MTHDNFNIIPGFRALCSEQGHERSSDSSMHVCSSEPSSTGYTLVEVLIATAVLAIALTGVASVVVQSNRLNGYNQEKKVARQAASDMMEQIQSKSYDEDQLTNFLDSKATFSVEGLSPIEGRKTVGHVTYTENPKKGVFPVKVNVIMRWEGIMGDSKFSLTKVFSKSF